MKASLALAVAAIAALTTGGASAQTAEPARSSLEIYRGLSVSSVRPLRMQLQPEGSTLGLTAIELGDGPALIEVTGDANRVYRVQILDGDAGDVSFEIFSTNAGDISATRISVMDADGHDMLRLTGDPTVLRRLFGAMAQIPLNIQYE